jgi:hypothetical protein
VVGDQLYIEQYVFFLFFEKTKLYMTSWLSQIDWDETIHKRLPVFPRHETNTEPLYFAPSLTLDINSFVYILYVCVYTVWGLYPCIGHRLYSYSAVMNDRAEQIALWGRGRFLFCFVFSIFDDRLVLEFHLLVRCVSFRLPTITTLI